MTGVRLKNDEVYNHGPAEASLRCSSYKAGARVVLSGLNDARVNGQTGTVTAHLQSGRYGVKLADGSLVAVRPCHMQHVSFVPATGALQVQHGDVDPSRLRIGCHVFLTGLSDNRLNGSKGTIITSLSSSRRLGVRLQSGRCVSVRVQNLEEIFQS